MNNCLPLVLVFVFLLGHTDWCVKTALLNHKEDLLILCLFNFLGLWGWAEPNQGGQETFPLVLVLFFSLEYTDMGVNVVLLSHKEDPDAALSTSVPIGF